MGEYGDGTAEIENRRTIDQAESLEELGEDMRAVCRVAGTIGSWCLRPLPPEE